uniref:Gal_mutarotas_2 domain-containing protein n=1 Tax=Echinostoma caproni TaxID=27848 RepID=A0A183AK50_9TREM
LVETVASSVIIADQFLQVGFKLNAQRAFLPGETRATFPHPLNEWLRVGLWARDTPPMDKWNLYGVHNMFMGLTSEGTAFGIFLLNSNAQEFVLTPMPSITYRTVGGILDFFLFAGPRPADVISQYYDLIGHPPVPPYWSLGFHLCRYGYKDLAEVEETVRRNREAGIPLEIQWVDIDYMDAYKIWSIGKENFGNLGKYVDEKLHQEYGMKFMIIVDPAVSTQVFINDSVTKAPIRGVVWPGETVFPDFSHPNAEIWWHEMAESFHKEISFDGLWVDMNEPADFDYGSVNGCPSDNKMDNPPYIPLILDRSLYAKTVCPSALHYNNTPHYNRHNLYGYDHARVTRKVLSRMFPTRRPFVLSRSTFAGSGRYTIHWTGDNLSSWADMRASIAQMINFNIYGIPMVGADICGFRGDATEELCVRWSQLGAFYPFSRNHNALASRPQDPAAWSANATAAIRAALNTRYHLLPYMYTLFFRAHLNGTTVARALAFEFPEDLSTHRISTQFMLGSCLLINPVVEEGRTNVEAYVPAGEWVDLTSATRIVSTGHMRNFKAPLHVIPILVRGGCVLPLQSSVNVTSFARKDGLNFEEAGRKSYASGELFWDDGESEPLNYVHAQFELRDRVLRLRATMSHRDTRRILDPKETALKRIFLVGISRHPTSVTMKRSMLEFQFIKDLQTVFIDLPPGSSITQKMKISWTFP